MALLRRTNAGSPALQTSRSSRPAITPRAVQRPASTQGAQQPCEPASAAPQRPEDAPSRRRALLFGLAAAAAAAASGPAAPPRAAAATEPYLLSTGARGLLAEEEAKLIELRKELEGEVRRELEAERQLLESEARASLEKGNTLCATPFGVDIVGITELVLLVGALVGGISARQRKAELERLNEQLRKVNMSLRQQARAGMVYAPGLTYVPPTTTNTAPPAPFPTNGTSSSAAAAPSAATVILAPPPPPPPAPAPVPAAPTPVPVVEPAAAAPAAAAAAPAPDRTLLSMDETEMSPDQIACRDALRQGKRLLKEKNGAAAMVRFEKALMLSKSLEDKVQERRAMRGLAAAARLQGQFRAAIKHLERVLEISRQMAEFTGDADAYGTIADCYTELGDFEAAAANYDKYIKVMNTDGPV